MLRGVIFDFNGTLFFDSNKHLVAMRRSFEERGLPHYDDAFYIEKVFGRTNRQIVLEYLNPHATEQEQDAWGAQKEIYYRAACLQDPATLRLAPGACEMLDYLKANGIPYAVATGSAIDNVEFYFSYLHLGRWFSFSNLIYCDNTYPGKPAPDIYHKAAAALGLRAEECVVFEDGSSGLRSAFAANAGAVCAVYERGLPDPVLPDMKPFCVCHDFTDWKETLRRAGLAGV